MFNTYCYWHEELKGGDLLEERQMSPDASLSFRRLALKNWWLGLGRSKKQDAKRKESGNYLLVPRISAYLAVISDSDFACMIRREGSPGRWRTSKGYFNFRKFAGSPSVGRVTAGCRFFFFYRR